MASLFDFFTNRMSTSASDSTDRGDDSSLQQQQFVTSNIGGKEYRLFSDDKYLQEVNGVFEPDMVQLFRSLVRQSDTVLDIGANIGCTTILFADIAQIVHSFEPSPSTFAFLQKNIKNANAQNVFLNNVGLGREAGEFELTFASDNRSGGFVSNKLNASDGHNVERIRIVQGDSYLESAGIKEVNFIKIDVEGFEKEVIEGLQKTIQRCRPVIALELNHWCLNAFQRISVPDFFDFLRQHFPYLYAVDKNDARNIHDKNDAYHVMYQHIVGGFKYPNLVGAFDASQLKQFSAVYGKGND